MRMIRNNYKTINASRIIKLDALCVNRLWINKQLINISGQVILTGIVSLQTMGICTISLWFEGYTPTNANEWIEVSDSSLINFELSTSGLTRQSWNMNEFVRYIALNCHAMLNSSIDLLSESIDTLISDESHYRTFLLKCYEKSSQQPFCYDIESYPLTFIEYDISKDELLKIFEVPSKISDFRLFLYGDLHWSIKSDSRIVKTVNEVNMSSRDSIKWLTTSLGTLKVAANDLENETSIEESFTAMLLETDIILSMRYFLMGIRGSLANLSRDGVAPITVSEMKEQIFINMDKYFNINLSHNDQTIRRLERMKEIFHINALYDEVKDRIDVLSVKINNENSATIERQQIFLTLIFGFFGSEQVMYAFFQDLMKDILHIGWIFLISFVASGLITFIIFLIMKKIKLKKNKKDKTGKRK